MFGKDKNNKGSSNNTEIEKAPTSFSNNNPVIPKPAGAGKDVKSGKSSSTTLIARDTEIFGDIKFSGSLEVEGAIVGNITANPGTDAIVRILENGQVEGDIHSPRVTINGQVKGTVHSSTLELAGKAKVDGNVHYQSIEMTKGAQVNGNLVYSENLASIPAKKPAQ